MEIVGWRRENDKRHASSTVSKGKCERVAMASAGVGMCGGLRRRALTFPSGAGSDALAHLLQRPVWPMQQPPSSASRFSCSARAWA